MAYAAIESAFGVAALLFHPLFDGVTRFAYESLLPGTQQSGAAHLLQWSLAAALILPQSILLGMTFPLMSASVLRQGSGRGGQVFAMLYFANSAGAVLGVLLAGFWLIEDYGLQATMMAAGAGNLVAAGSAAWIAGGARATAPALIEASRPAGWEDLSLPSRSSRAPPRSSTRSHGCACWRWCRARRRMHSRPC